MLKRSDPDKKLNIHFKKNYAYTTIFWLSDMIYSFHITYIHSPNF